MPRRKCVRATHLSPLGQAHAHTLPARIWSLRGTYLYVWRVHIIQPLGICTCVRACMHACVRACEFGHARASDIWWIYTIRSVHPAPSCYATGTYGDQRVMAQCVGISSLYTDILCRQKSQCWIDTFVYHDVPRQPLKCNKSADNKLPPSGSLLRCDNWNCVGIYDRMVSICIAGYIETYDFALLSLEFWT